MSPPAFPAQFSFSGVRPLPHTISLSMSTYLKHSALVLLLLFGFFTTYAALTPGAIASIGYTGEEMAAVDSFLKIMDAGLAGQKLTLLKWPRQLPPHMGRPGDAKSEIVMTRRSSVRRRGQRR